MKVKINSISLKLVSSIVIVTLLSGCDTALLNPGGQVGFEQRSIIITASCLMLIVVIPVILMALSFSWKYRVNNKYAKYRPDWSYSSKIEFIVWMIPVIIILVLSILTWKTTHLLDPANNFLRTDKSVNIEVVSMDWKWLFIYPEQGIATINEVVFPINTELKFRLTSNSVMNSFFIPKLGSQIYTMPGMETKLYLVANSAGLYNGISASYSGHGFSEMKFTVVATKDYAEFNNWVKKVKKSTYTISSMMNFEKIAIPSKENSVKYFSNIKSNLFRDIINKSLIS